MVYTDTTPLISTPQQVLDAVAGVRDQMRLLDQGLVVFAVEWVKLNPGQRLHELPYASTRGIIYANDDEALWEDLSDLGCLRVDDLSIPEFAIAAGVSEYAARKLIREALMLVHLLPRVWARVVAGGVEVWRARLLAADCWQLSPDAVGYVDRHMSGSMARITVNTREKIIGEARRRFMAEDVAAEDAAALERRGVHFGDPTTDGQALMPLWGELDVTDALDVKTAIKLGAQALADIGSDAPVNVRRAWALGDLARAALGQGSLALDSGGAASDTATGGSGCSCTCRGHHSRQVGLISTGVVAESRGSPPLGPESSVWWVPPGQAPPSHISQYPNVTPSRSHWNGKGTYPPRVQLYIHMNHTAIPPPGDKPGKSPESHPGGPPSCLEHPDNTGSPGEVVRVESPNLPAALLVDPEQVKDWLTRPTLITGSAPHVIIRPVLDLEEDLYSGAYEVPDRVSEHRMLTTGSCVFPHCTRPAWACDIDHIQPWNAGGVTCSCNLAPLCRRHHRVKTHGDNTSEGHAKWSVTALGGGDYRWTGPGGIALLRTNHGTWDAHPHQTAGGPAHPSITAASITTQRKSGTGVDVARARGEDQVDHARPGVQQRVEQAEEYIDTLLRASTRTAALRADRTPTRPSVPALVDEKSVEPTVATNDLAELCGDAPSRRELLEIDTTSMGLVDESSGEATSESTSQAASDAAQADELGPARDRDNILASFIPLREYDSFDDSIRDRRAWIHLNRGLPDRRTTIDFSFSDWANPQIVIEPDAA